LLRGTWHTYEIVRAADLDPKERDQVESALFIEAALSDGMYADDEARRTLIEIYEDLYGSSTDPAADRGSGGASIRAARIGAAGAHARATDMV
jgi:hypothetical protein